MMKTVIPGGFNGPEFIKKIKNTKVQNIKAKLFHLIVQKERIKTSMRLETEKPQKDFELLVQLLKAVLTSIPLLEELKDKLPVIYKICSGYLSESKERSYLEEVPEDDIISHLAD